MGDTVTVGELLARVRATYVEDFAQRLAEGGRTDPERMVPEVTLCDSDGMLVREGGLGLPRRVDACVPTRGEKADVIQFPSERMLEFDPLSLVWGDGLEVELNPFTWDACELRFAPPEDGDLAALKSWFQRWFDEADERSQTNEFPGGVVHSLTGPDEDGDSWVVVIDLGSVRLKAFEELLDAVAAMGRRRVTIGHAGAP